MPFCQLTTIQALAMKPFDGGGDQSIGVGLYGDKDHIRRICPQIVDAGGYPRNGLLQVFGPLDDDARFEGRLDQLGDDIAQGDIMPLTGQKSRHDASHRTGAHHGELLRAKIGFFIHESLPSR